ncbi:MAG: selenium cofactor biosynthesis protein YqeC [Clostridium sp.]
MFDMYKELGIDIEEKYMISFVGGGGKTSLMFSLANQLQRFGSDLVTTTTKIFCPKEDEYSALYLLDSVRIEDIDPIKNKITVIGQNINNDNKIIGLPKEVLDTIHGKGVFDFILVEADGAKGKPIKAPNVTEPIIPDKTNINIGVMGVDALDEDISSICFRYEIFSSITQNTTKVDDESVISLINHPLGLFKGTPETCKRYLVINKCDNNQKIKRGRDLLKKVICKTQVDKVFVSSIHKGNFQSESLNVCGIVMASGMSKRMGQNKLIMKIENKSMIKRVTSQCVNSHLRDVIVVYNEDIVLRQVCSLPIKTAHNLSPEMGQSMSIKVGLKSISDDYDGYMFLVGDQPFIDSKLINKLLNRFEMDKKSIVIPCYRDDKGTPVIFPSLYKKDLICIQGDSGGREIIKHCENISKVLIEDKNKGMDIDTIEEYISIGGE